jgi:sugar phosphate isomerase/epimerase
MTSRRNFLRHSSILLASSLVLPPALSAAMDAGNKVENIGVQLFTFREAMTADPLGTLQKIAALGIKQIESAGSGLGYYYGLEPRAMQMACQDLGMTLRSGHVRIDDNWQQTMEDAVAAGQEYLICSTMPSTGQTIDNYKSVAEVFNQAGEACKSLNLKFGYHNHAYEYETENGEVLYDVLMDNTDPDLVHMELDLGWVIVGGKDPLDYFNKYPGRFPLWHLKDMNMALGHSTEFGKGGLDIVAMLQNGEKSGVKHIFVEQEEYASTPFESMQENMDYLHELSY